MSHSIRRANKNEIPQLVEFWQAIDAYPEGVRPFGGDSDDKPLHAKQLLEHTLDSEKASVLVALNEEEIIIGTISGHVFDKPAVNISNIGVIYSLWVNEGYRYQGVAQELLSTLETSLQEKGAQAFQVGWDTSNTTASSWWQKRGYSPYEMIASKLISPSK